MATIDLQPTIPTTNNIGKTMTATSVGAIAVTLTPSNAAAATTRMDLAAVVAVVMALTLASSSSPTGTRMIVGSPISNSTAAPTQQSTICGCCEHLCS